MLLYFLLKNYLEGVLGGGFFASCSCRENEQAVPWPLVFVLFFLEIILPSKHFSNCFGVFYGLSYAAMVCWALKKTENNGRAQQCPMKSITYALCVPIK